ncbi:hypothetical protein M5K25_008218 [Dendrobium thyrsiflorum]|uniref:Uncharacterized protein n=1 Tax=Dendrobium thyrsiflorum TaxID=117978 RepID=A0ABD0VEV0_DENTH
MKEGAVAVHWFLFRFKPIRKDISPLDALFCPISPKTKGKARKQQRRSSWDFGDRGGVLAGLLKPTEGTLHVNKPKSFVFQNPDHQCKHMQE